MPANVVNASSFNVIHLFLNASFMVKLVILGLLLASLVSWAIAIDRFNLYKIISNNINRFESIFWSGKSFEQIASFYENQPLSDASLVFISVMKEWQKARIMDMTNSSNFQMRLNKVADLSINRTIQEMEKYLSFLATVSSTAPFIGLFGTVIGIMGAFSSIATAKNTSLAVVAPGIAEALLATAIGLFAAIPAVILYNRLLSMMNNNIAKIENFSDEFLSIISRKIEEKITKPEIG